MRLLIIFLSTLIIHGLEYDIDNQQICTHRPFQANFNHNCSRTRLIANISVPNTDDDLYITVIFESSSNIPIILNITKSSIFDQKIHFTFVTFNQRYIIVNNETILILGNTTINLYLYDTSSENIISTVKPYLIPELVSLINPYCILKTYQEFLPPLNITRIYYLYTNETNLYLDFSLSTYRIAPLIDRFQSCFTTKTDLTAAAIVLIVVISILSGVTLVLIGFCLKKQLTQLLHIFRNRLRGRLGILPQVTIGAPTT